MLFAAIHSVAEERPDSGEFLSPARPAGVGNGQVEELKGAHERFFAEIGISSLPLPDAPHFTADVGELVDK